MTRNKRKAAINRSADSNSAQDYRYKGATRKNNPAVGLALYDKAERVATRYAYDPHLDPQLIWAGKAERTSFEVDVVSLHIHERISTKAIVRALKKPEYIQLSLFADPALPLEQEIDFYQHEVDWANRLILGDSLLVMNSLLVRENMAGKVQMIYVDPPYGIKYASNFQPALNARDVKEDDASLTRQPEQIKAYRDTWRLGIHSYLTYLRDRLLLCRELLADSGSIFVQINDENLHLVRNLLDEVFGRENFVALIAFLTTTGRGARYIDTVYDFLVWYAKEKGQIKYNQMFIERSREMIDERYVNVELPNGETRKLSSNEIEDDFAEHNVRRFRLSGLTSQGATTGETSQPFFWQGREYRPSVNRHWSTTHDGLRRLSEAQRLTTEGSALVYKRYHEDFPIVPLRNIWTDTGGGALVSQKLYVVQTAEKVIERCLLMTTDPGDLVFDPTCGSGTTAYCAEKWGRRWITCDTSRVALALARQRLMTATFDYYELADPDKGVSGGFIYETVPHITLESIAKNAEIDAIAAKYQPELDRLREEISCAVGQELKEWEIPLKVPEEWDERARELHRQFKEVKLKKKREIDESIQKNAPQETLYDRPKVKRGVVRVSGPFTVEAIPMPVIADPDESPIPQFEEQEAGPRSIAGDYLASMIELISKNGVVFPGGRRMELANMRPLSLGILHAEAESGELRVAISFGPQYGPVTVHQVSEAILAARANGYDALILAGFSFDSGAQDFLEKIPLKGLSVHFANISPDVLLGDLLKTPRHGQLFTVFGQPDVRLYRKTKQGEWMAADAKDFLPAMQKGAISPDAECLVEVRGVDVYDPNTGECQSISGQEVAAWFLDVDYDGKVFHVCQAFFPNGGKNPWDKLERALKGKIDKRKFEDLRGTVSFPFLPGENRRVAVKVIDFRGNEVMRILPL